MNWYHGISQACTEDEQVPCLGVSGRWSQGVGAVASNFFMLLNASAWAFDQENGMAFWVRAVRGLMVVTRFGQYGDR